MPRTAGAALLTALAIAAASPTWAQTIPTPPPGGPSQTTATVTCPFDGRAVRTIIANPRDTTRACNATCIWRYGQILYRGAGGARLAPGESKTVYNALAPVKIDAAVESGISCDK
jgi:hypothetical protein